MKTKIILDKCIRLEDTDCIEFCFPEHPEWAHYSVELPRPYTKQNVRDAIYAKAREVKAKQEANEALRQQVKSMGLAEEMQWDG